MGYAHERLCTANPNLAMAEQRLQRAQSFSSLHRPVTKRIIVLSRYQCGAEWEKRSLENWAGSGGLWERLTYLFIFKDFGVPPLLLDRNSSQCSCSRLPVARKGLKREKMPPFPDWKQKCQQNVRVCVCVHMPGDCCCLLA